MTLRRKRTVSQNVLDRKDRVAYIFLLVFSILLILPLLYAGQATFGGDTVFHYNRFYETAMQIKNWNFSYFINLYGFHASARITNAVYGPLFSYIQGLLVLLAGTWFRYQLLSNFLLYFIASSSFYRLLRKAEVQVWLSLVLACCFVTTYSVFLWSIVHGVRSWGTAVLPLCLIPAVEYYQTKKIFAWKVAGAVALMWNIHNLLALFLILLYLTFFGWNFLRSSSKWVDILALLKSIAIFLLLTPHLWLTYIILFSRNHLYTVFVTDLSDHTLESALVLVKISVGVLLLAIFLYLTFFFYRNKTALFSLVTISSFLWIASATKVFPWRWLSQQDFFLANQIQFPTRLFEIGLMLVLFAVGLQYAYLSTKGKWLFKGMLGLAVLFQLGIFLKWHYNYATSVYDIQTSEAAYLYHAKAGIEEVRESMKSTDLTMFLSLVESKTPDYLPDRIERNQAMTEKASKAYYDYYHRYINETSHQFQKTVQGNRLILTWENEQEEQVYLPVTIYRDTQLILDGQPFSSKGENLTEISTLVLASAVGEHTLEVSYATPLWLSIALICQTLMILLTLFFCFKKENKGQSK